MRNIWIWINDHVGLAVGIVTVIGFLGTATFTAVRFYIQAEVAHKLAESHVNEINHLRDDNERIELEHKQTSEQLQALTNTYRREQDTREYATLAKRKESLSIQERVRYCELFRSLGLGDSCDLAE